MITHAPTGRMTTYGRVANAAAKLTPPANPPLKDPKDWKIAGQPLYRLDTADKLTGRQVFSRSTPARHAGLNAAIVDCRCSAAG